MTNILRMHHKASQKWCGSKPSSEGTGREGKECESIAIKMLEHTKRDVRDSHWDAMKTTTNHSHSYCTQTTSHPF